MPAHDHDNDNDEIPPAPARRTLPGVDRIDPRKLAPIYGLQTHASEPEYLKYNIKGRDIFGRLFFNSGVAWLGGFSVAGAYGFAEGWRNAANPSFKVKLNSVMNAVSKRGSKVGNALGTIGMTSNEVAFIFPQFFSVLCSVHVHVFLVGC